MLIAKIIPESSIDYRKKFGPVIFTSGCNLKCGFCHNPELIKQEEFDKRKMQEQISEIKNIKDKTEAGWYNGICITGGEPTLHKKLPEFIFKLKSLGLSVKLDTNGSNPEMVKKLIENNLIDYLALDIKATPKLYNLVTGVKFNMKKLEKTVKILSESKINFEFRTTLIPVIEKKVRWFTENEIENIANWISNLTKNKRNLWVLQKFVSRDKGEILDDSYSKESLPLEFHETPENTLLRTHKIISKKFNCEIV